MAYEHSDVDENDMGYEDTMDEKAQLFLDMYRKAANFEGNGSNPKGTLPQPLEVLQAYTDKKTRTLVDKIFSVVTKPTFVPILKEQANNSPISINPVVFILAHAVQILKFAPIGFDEAIDFEEGTYDRRFPTKLEGGGTDLVVCNKTYSMEDLNRATLLFYQFIIRRDKRRNLINRAPPVAKTAFLGYADPDFQHNATESTGIDLTVNEHARAQLAFEKQVNKAKAERRARAEENEERNQDVFFEGTGRLQKDKDDEPITGIDALDIHENIIEAFGSTNLSETVASKIASSGQVMMPFMSAETENMLVEALISLHPVIDHEANLAKVQQQLAKFKNHVNPEELDSFIQQQKECPEILEYAKKYPGNLDGLLEEIKRLYLLEKITSSLQPDHDYDLDMLSDFYDIPKYPDLRLYPDEDAEPLMAHQLADVHHIIERMLTPAPFLLLANEMGTGKTKTFLAAILLRIKRIEKEEPRYGKYLPTLLLSPVSTIVQTHNEITEHFPTLRVLTYFSTPSTFPAEGATVLGTKRLSIEMTKLNSEEGRHDPSTGRTIVLSTYPTMSKRVMRKEETLFRWKDEHVPASVKKKRNAMAKDGDTPTQSQKVKKFAHETVDQDEITLLKRGSSLAPDGNLVSYFHRNNLAPNWKFDLLICDEAQYVKRESGSYHNMLRMLSWKRLLFVSGTPLTTSLRDLLSPLSLVHHISGRIQSLDVLNESILSWVPGLYHADYDPLKAVNKIDHAGSEQLTAGIFHEDTLDKVEDEGSKQYLLKLKDAWVQGDKSFRHWLISPHLLKLAARDLSWGTQLGALVIKPILRQLYIRRTMRTPTKLPNGELTFPGKGVLPSTIVVEEMRYWPDSLAGQEVDFRGRLCAKQLFSNQNPQTADHSVSNENISPNPSEAQLNFGIHREGVLGALDPRNMLLLEPKEASFHGSKSRLERHFAQFASNLPETLTRAKNAKAIENPGHQVVLGLEHVDELIRSSTNGGLDYLFLHTRSDPHLLAPSDRAAFLRWFAAESPVIIRVFQLLLQWVRKEKQRVLLFVDTPWIQSVVVSALTLHGYVVGTVRSNNTAAERASIIAQWNNPKSKLQVFVANIQTMSTGVNLHKCCCKGAFLNWHLSASSMHQMIGRLNRLGQKGAVDFRLLKVQDSYHDNIERLNVTKWMIQLSAEIGLPSWLQYELLEICICEAMKSSWHMPFNRYSWIVEREMSKGDMAYHSDHVITMGHMFSMMARVLLETDDDIERAFWSDNVNYIAEAARRLTKAGGKIASVAMAEKYLGFGTDKLKKKLKALFSEECTKLKKEFEEDNTILRRNERMRQAVKDRKAKAVTKATVDDSGSDESDGLDDGEASEVDDGLVDANANAGGKRKSIVLKRSRPDPAGDSAGEGPSTRTPAPKRKRAAASNAESNMKAAGRPRRNASVGKAKAKPGPKPAGTGDKGKGKAKAQG
ncbi:hypothetical protein Neosp_006850 [[Neocosmospora] mangrovei]